VLGNIPPASGFGKGGGIPIAEAKVVVAQYCILGAIIAFIIFLFFNLRGKKR
jgi:hypothetical protein